MVTLVVATTTDPASFGPASALSAMGDWKPGVSFQGIRSKVNGEVRSLEHDKGIVEEDHLDNRWEEVTGEVVEEIIFLSKHTAVSNRPALTIHPIGVPHLKEGDVPPQGGKPGWAAVPSPRMTAWLILLKKLAQSHNLIPEFEITLEATHHGPVTNKPTMFVEIGRYLKHLIPDVGFLDYGTSCSITPAVQLNAGRGKMLPKSLLKFIWEGLGIGGGEAVGNWNSMSGNRKVLLGIGGGHYAPRHMDIILKGGVWVGHLLSGYSLPMEDPGQSKDIGGTWKQAIKAAYDATKEGFPGGEIIAHLDHKSFKGWQKKAIMEYLGEQNIKIGKPGDFY